MSYSVAARVVCESCQLSAVVYPKDDCTPLDIVLAHTMENDHTLSIERLEDERATTGPPSEE